MDKDPKYCPYTGLPFFMEIDGKPTYGGPYDSYTIPVESDDGEFYRERFCHDEGCWKETQWVDVCNGCKGMVSAYLQMKAHAGLARKRYEQEHKRANDERDFHELYAAENAILRQALTAISKLTEPPAGYEEDYLIEIRGIVQRAEGGKE